MHKSFLLLCFLMAFLPLCSAQTVTHFISPGTEQKDTLKRHPEKADSMIKKKPDGLSDKNNKKESEYDKLLKKGGSLHKGLFDVRHIEKDWYFEVPRKALGRLFLAVTRFTSVPQGFSRQPGEETQDNTFYLEKHDDKTLLVRAYTRSTFSRKGDDIATLVDKATIDPVIRKFDIIGTDSLTGKMLIKVTPLFQDDNSISGISSSVKTQTMLGSVQHDLAFIDTIRTYPINIEVSMMRTYIITKGRLGGPDGPGMGTISLNTSIVELPQEPMQPRLADERVGYFQNRITEFADDKPSRHDAIISRYRLVPKDKRAYARGKLTEPVKPIVYYIDPATPRKWVPYLIAGINDWNKAFEAAGFKNAIQGREWPENSDMSVDDARYCVLRYLPSENENAYGPRIVDPRSGEIIESHICWYHNVMNLIRDWYIVQCGPLDKRAQGYHISDELMGQLIRFVSSHEVGHTLGLRHNMIASSATPVEKLRDKAWVEAHGHTASIMDYARFNYVAQPEDQVSPRGLFPRINDYDCWAIKWGYQYRPEFTDPYQEQKKLRAEVSRVLRGNIRLRYSGDEGSGQDPRSQTEDLGDNSMTASSYGLKNLARVMSHIEQWTAQPDGLADDLTDLYKSARAQYKRYVFHVMRNIGGQYNNNTPDEKRTMPVPSDRQQQAVRWIGDNVFEAPLWLYPENVTDKTGVNTNDEVMSLDKSLVISMLGSQTLLTQMRNNINGDHAYPVDQYLHDVFQAAWKPMPDAQTRQNAYRRQIERQYLISLNYILNPTAQQRNGLIGEAANSDVALYVLRHLGTIEDFCKAQKAQCADGSVNALHYDNLLLQIKKMREQYNKPEEN